MESAWRDSSFWILNYLPAWKLPRAIGFAGLYVLSKRKRLKSPRQGNLSTSYFTGQRYPSPQYFSRCKSPCSKVATLPNGMTAMQGR